jgi:signal transduction histidine kinase
MLVTCVLVASILLQLVAAGLALRLVLVTGAGRAWTWIALAVLLMAARRSIVLYRLTVADMAHPPDLLAEGLSLAISLLLVIGIAGCGPLFMRLRRARDVLKRSHDELDRRVARRTAELAAMARSLEETIAERSRTERELSEVAARQQQTMGQELHDGLGQQLLGLRLMSAGLAKALENQGHSEAESARELVEGLTGAQQSVRALIRGIRPVEVDAHGLMAGLAELAERTEQLSGVPCVFRCRQPTGLECNHTATQLFFIASEAVANAVRHARPQHIEIGLARNDHHLQLWVRDDGCGLAGPVDQVAGMGIRIMRHRASVLDAKLNITPVPGGGTLVSCTVPMENLA